MAGWVAPAAAAASSLFGGGGGEQNKRSYNWSWGSPALPPALQPGVVDPFIQGGISGIGALLQRPGGLAPGVAEAILPRTAMASENVARQFRGMQANQAGAAARSNLPISIKNALSSALDVAQERAQRDVRRGALSESEQLRRQDLSQVYQLLNSIYSALGAGDVNVGQAAQTAAQVSGQNMADQRSQQAALLSAIGSLAGADWTG